jgi:hypothetical protein
MAISNHDRVGKVLDLLKEGFAALRRARDGYGPGTADRLVCVGRKDPPYVLPIGHRCLILMFHERQRVYPESTQVSTTVVIMQLRGQPMHHDVCRGSIAQGVEATGAPATRLACGGESAPQPGPRATATGAARGRSGGAKPPAGRECGQTAARLAGRQTFVARLHGHDSCP